MRLVTSREDGNKVSDGSTEDTHRGEEFGVCIWGVASRGRAWCLHLGCCIAGESLVSASEVLHRGGELGVCIWGVASRGRAWCLHLGCCIAGESLVSASGVLHRGRELGVCIWGVAVLQHCSLQSISVELTI